TGVRLSPGGSHPGLGTRNRLADLGDGAYLEVIGPDPDQPAPAEPRPFALDDLTSPRLVTWSLRVADLDAAVAHAKAQGHNPGPILPMSRPLPDGPPPHPRRGPPPPRGPERPPGTDPGPHRIPDRPPAPRPSPSLRSSG